MLRVKWPKHHELSSQQDEDKSITGIDLCKLCEIRTITPANQKSTTKQQQILIMIYYDVYSTTVHPDKIE